MLGTLFWKNSLWKITFEFMEEIDNSFFCQFDLVICILNMI